MIWLLLIFFVPGGLNQNISTDMPYRIIHPCDDTNISAIVQSPIQGHLAEYYLLIPIPTWGTDLLLKFDSKTNLKLIKPGRKLYISKYPNAQDYHIKFFSGIDKVLNCTILVTSSTIPYIENIRLNQDNPYKYTIDLCKHPKTGYFNDLKTQKKTVKPDIASSTMSNASEENSGDPNTTLLQLLKPSSYYEKTDAPYIVSSTMSNAPDDKTDAPNIVSSMMSNAVFPSMMPNVSHVKEFSLDESCGKRKVVHTELIVHGLSSNSGQWPWHVAIFRIEQHSLKYICGGTLLSKTLVLTAAHCASIRGSPVVPEALRLQLGNFNLFGGDLAAQVREVFRVIIHPKFDGFTLDNDIALLKLKSEAVITNYVRPACLWYEEANLKFPVRLIFGTIVGWGFDHHDLISSTLRQITIPIVPELTCLKSNPTFFHKKLNYYKFCGGFANGTSACNGDSGGGFMIFVPDAPGTASGAWHVRGIVSIAPSRIDAPICDPYEYTIFTDVEKYRDWLLEYME